MLELLESSRLFCAGAVSVCYVLLYLSEKRDRSKEENKACSVSLKEKIWLRREREREKGREGITHMTKEYSKRVKLGYEKYTKPKKSMISEIMCKTFGFP